MHFSILIHTAVVILILAVSLKSHEIPCHLFPFLFLVAIFVLVNVSDMI